MMGKAESPSMDKTEYYSANIASILFTSVAGRDG